MTSLRVRWRVGIVGGIAAIGVAAWIVGRDAPEPGRAADPVPGTEASRAQPFESGLPPQRTAAAATAGGSDRAAVSGAAVSGAAVGGAAVEPPAAEITTATSTPTAPAPSTAPAVLAYPFIAASLRALADHGADLKLPMRTTHQVASDSAAEAAGLADWARAQGFQVDAPQQMLEHGSEPVLLLALVRRAVPSPAAIQADGRAIAAYAAAHPGLTYHTWQGEITRP